MVFQKIIFELDLFDFWLLVELLSQIVGTTMVHAQSRTSRVKKGTFKEKISNNEHGGSIEKDQV